LQLEDALKYMREGDTLVIWKLSRLAMCKMVSSAKKSQLNLEA